MGGPGGGTILLITASVKIRRLRKIFLIVGLTMSGRCARWQIMGRDLGVGPIGISFPNSSACLAYLIDLTMAYFLD
jgi:hypothetical protein